MSTTASSSHGDLFVVPKVHAEGLNQVAYSPDGKFLYSTGTEGYMRIHDAQRDGDAAFPVRLVEYHTDGITSVSATNELICTAGEDNAVVLYHATKGNLDDPKNEQHSLLLRTGAGILPRVVRFDPKGKRVAVVQDKLETLIIDAQDNTNLVKLQHDSDHGEPRCVSWSPDGAYVTTSTKKGFLKVWDLPGGNSGTCVRSIDGVIPMSSEESVFSVEVVWHPSGKYFVVINKTNEIVKLSRETWSRTATFIDNTEAGHSTSQITQLAWSPNGNYLASANDEGKIMVWNASTLQVVSRMTTARGAITSLQFHPAKNELMAVNFSGDVLKWAQCVPSELTGPHVLPPPLRNTSSTSHSHSHNHNNNSTKAEPTKAKRVPMTVGEELAAEMGGNFFEEDALDDSWMNDSDSEEAGRAKARREREEEEDDDDAENLDREEMRAMIDDDELDLDDDIVAKSRAGAGAAARDWLDPVIRGVGGRVARKERDWSAPRGQDAFQPGSTPTRERRRYLAFNMLGLIHVVERGDEHDPQSLVTIEFHDRSAQVGSHFTDTHSFTHGALGELGSVFSVTGKGESPSLICYKPHESWAPVHEWLYELPAGENATGLAIGGMSESGDEDSVGIAGTGTVLVATDKGYIRSFSGSGLQKYVWNLGKEVVTMSAGKDWAIIVYRGAGGPVDGDQNLEFTLLDLDTFEAIQERKVVPLGRGATLKWIGFTDENIPVMYDSQGILSILDAARRPGKGRWVPLLDMHALERRKGKQESYWPIGVTEKNVNAIILKGEERYPHFPTPIFQEIELQMPLLRLDVQQGLLEEEFLRGTILIAQRRDGASPDDFALKSSLARQEVLTDKKLLVIIQTACKAENLQAALDACLLLSQPASLDAAKKIAAFFQLPALEDRIDLVKEAKTGLRRAEEDNKRAGKWSHLVDDRTVTNAPPRHAQGPSSTPAFSDFSYARPSSTANSNAGHFMRQSSVAPAARPKVGAPPRIDSGFAGSDEIAGDEHPLDDEQDSGWNSGDEPASKRRRSTSAEDAPMAPVKSNRALNPFAKVENKAAKAGPPAASSTFGKKAKQPATDLQRTGSFFDRAGGDAPPKSKSKSKSSKEAPVTVPKAPTGPRQTTLFGLPPPDPKPVEKKGGKKRKSTDNATTAEDDDAATETSAKKASRGMDAFVTSSGLPAGTKELPREGDEFEETQLDETQVDETQASRSGALETHAEEDVEMDEPPVALKTSQKENAEPLASAPTKTMSKLEQFRRVEVPAAE